MCSKSHPSVVVLVVLIELGWVRSLLATGAVERDIGPVGVCNIHMFVKFDEFSMNLSPNAIRHRQLRDSFSTILTSADKL